MPCIFPCRIDKEHAFKQQKIFLELTKLAKNDLLHVSTTNILISGQEGFPMQRPAHRLITSLALSTLAYFKRPKPFGPLLNEAFLQPQYEVSFLAHANIHYLYFLSQTTSNTVLPQDF